MRKCLLCLLCLLLALCLLGGALAEESLPQTGIGTHTANFAAVHDGESGAMYFVLQGTLGYPAFWRYHPDEGWRKIAQVWNDVWDVQYSGGWLFYKKTGGWSGGYSDLHAVHVKTGKKVHLLKNRCSLITAHEGEAIVWDSQTEQYVRLNPETMARKKIDWRGGWHTMNGVSWKEADGAWYFQPHGGEVVPLNIAAEVQDVYALSPDCYVTLTGALDFQMTIHRGGEVVFSGAYTECLVDDRYIVWYTVGQERTTQRTGGVTVTTAAETHIKHLYIYDTQAGPEHQPLQVSIPVEMRIDRGMYLADGQAMILTTDGRHPAIACVALATGAVTTLTK